ncbi:MAG TPA: UTP--glucose-1-phosphate uridylyltransferase [Rhodopirellula baltica]|uniref:Similar to UTP--glucose-1-phosphate uridylyltransferase n=1 Tax=Rhodopirellula baltica (strain DSM 10527 / NCIMB 13988 / SH1) TaxID=243090 RepID=Q7UM36_RHOBA|nr:UTP--glucose-1-phosphate uridylyltransferase [Rhodopirellula baltica]CAD76081.1 similar to UTP--glucose-1-phosphate uridylyltransferase [Rhodopirellula baltica SH 1]HBE65200.1 UTP--glucose-1-phosphate uridylyltransferase [Rhodopirellula baltica]
MPELRSMNSLIETITTDQANLRDRSLESLLEDVTLSELLDHVAELDRFRRQEDNLYQRVRALFFLSAIYRYHLPPRLDQSSSGSIPFEGYEHLLGRRFQEAIDEFLEVQSTDGASDSLSSALASAYHELGFQTLADQVRHSVRTVRGNQWMFRLGHVAEHPLRIRKELLPNKNAPNLSPVLKETTAVRMDVSHSAWSDIFFLGMDYPEGARVINVSVDLGVRGRDDQVRPPIETYLRVIDKPVFRLVSVDLNASVEVTTIAEMFDFARDYLGLLKAAVIAAGVVPPGLEGCGSDMASLLERVVGRGKGLELVSKINDIPKGSRLAVSTNLLGSLISNLMRATGQIQSLQGELTEPDRRLIAARAILGEWIGGSGGGWQDSGGVWPGIKLICGQTAGDEDPEFGISRGRLMPDHEVLGEKRVSAEARQKLQDSLVVVHGGMAQNVGPILEMVTEHYLVRGRDQWIGRQEAMRIYDEVVDALQQGDIRRLGSLTTENFEGPLQTIIPWATNRFTDVMIQRCREQYGDQFWGFWMLGGMSGGGMGFIFDPTIKQAAQDWLSEEMVTVKRQLETALPFAMDPVVYDFRINDHGTFAELIPAQSAVLPQKYYALMMPKWLRKPLRDLSPQTREELAGISRRCSDPNDHDANAALLLRSVLPSDDKTASSQNDEAQTSDDSLAAILKRSGFDRSQHEQIRADMRAGKFGLAANRLSRDLKITDVSQEHVTDTRDGLDDRLADIGSEAIANGEIGVITLAAGVGSRWTQGAGVCKALHPFHRFAGKHRSFLEIHLAKNRATTAQHGGTIPHVITTSWMTDEAIRTVLDRTRNYGHDGPVHVSSGRSVGLRMVPMVRDLHFLWEETAQQVLDQQQQKMRESARSAIANWAQQTGEGSDYTDNVAAQCVHPVGHWYEVPNLFRNGVLSQMLRDQPSLRYLMLHNIDTLGANVDPALFGLHIESGATLSYEVIPRRLEDRGGGLALVAGRPRLVEGLAMPDERIEFGLKYYNSMTTWIDIDALLDSFGLNRESLNDASAVDAAVRQMAARLPTYITLKEVKKRWGHAQEDVFPVAQFEKLWGDMTTLSDIDSRFIVTPMRRGQQLKEPSQLDGWNRDGGSAYVDDLCKWNES